MQYDAIIQSIDSAKRNQYPQTHIDALIAGGFDVDLDETYTDREIFYIHTMGIFMSLLANGTLDTLGDPVLERFVEVTQDRAGAKTDAESAWIKFTRDYPQYKN